MASSSVVRMRIHPAIVDFFLGQPRPASSADKKIASLMHVIAGQEGMFSQIEASIDENNRKAELIYHNYGLVSEVLSVIKEARKKHSWTDIKNKLAGHPLIKEINERQGIVVIEIDQ